jgi:hypothetical protein
MKKEQRGFIALISVLIISAILLTLVVTMGFAAWFARADVLANEQSQTAQQESRGCIDVALRILTNAPDPSTFTLHDQNIAIDGSHTCAIVSIIHDNNTVVISTAAKEGNVVSHVISHVALAPYMRVIQTARF